MIQHQIYQCPKCFNTLLVSNRMLHDLRCTIENPATYENILRQSQQMSNEYNENIDDNKGFSGRMSITNDDGTTIDIVREKSIRGKDELIEIKYDPQGNIISRKRADYYIPQTNNSFHELSELNEEDDNNFKTNYDNNNNTYYETNNEIEVRKAPSVIYKTAEAQEIVYEAPAKYDPHVTINKPIFQEAVINNSNGSLSQGTLDHIIRNTMNQSGGNFNNFNFENDNFKVNNDTNINGYNFSENYSQINNDINSNINNQNYDINNYNDNNINYGNNDIYSSLNQNGGNDLYGASTGFENNNFNSYDNQY